MAGLEVKTRADINWGWYGTDVWQSQLDRYAARAAQLDAGQAPLYLVVAASNRALVEQKLTATGEWRIASAESWTVLTLDELLERAPEAQVVPADAAAAGAVRLLTSLLAEP